VSQNEDVHTASLSPEDAEFERSSKSGESLANAASLSEQSHVPVAAKRSSRRQMSIDIRQPCLECGDDCQLVHNIEGFRNIDATEYGDMYYCDKCNSGSPSWPAWHCHGCGSDWCTPCAMKKKKTKKRKRKEKTRT